MSRNSILTVTVAFWAKSPTLTVTLFPECVAVPFEVVTELTFNPDGIVSVISTFSAVTA